MHAASQAGVCTLGVFPYVPALKIGELFSPMALEFGETLGIDIQLRTNETFEKFASELAAGSYDIALAHPFLYVDAHEAQGYEAIASVDQKLRAVIVSRRTQPVGRLAELRGQTLALPPRGAGVSYLLRLAMLEEGLIPGVDLHLRHHQTKVSCLHAVAAEEAVGCVVPSFLGDQLRGDERDAARADLAEPADPEHRGHRPSAHARRQHAPRSGIACWVGRRQTAGAICSRTWLGPEWCVATDADYDGVRRLAAKLRAAASG